MKSTCQHHGHTQTPGDCCDLVFPHTKTPSHTMQEPWMGSWMHVPCVWPYWNMNIFNYRWLQREHDADRSSRAVISSVVMLFSQCVMCKSSIPAGRSARMTHEHPAGQQHFIPECVWITALNPELTHVMWRQLLFKEFQITLTNWSLLLSWNTLKCADWVSFKKALTCHTLSLVSYGNSRNIDIYAARHWTWTRLNRFYT